jgi:transposase
MKIRQISVTLKISRNTVRRVLRGGDPTQCRLDQIEDLGGLLRELFAECKGNAVRIRERLMEKYSLSIPYSTLTRLVRIFELREGKKKRAGSYELAPGEEMQHDTSPHRILLGEKTVTAQCASLVLAFCRRIYVQYYPSFTRFEARVFLARAFDFMQGTCPRCTIDNTSVIVARGSGPDALIAPEMEGFGRIYRVRFIPHRVGDANRKARVERPFSYIEGNFLAGRTFRDWQDLNRQALEWCEKTANLKPKRSLGMICPQEAWIMEKPHLQDLPPYIPPVYLSLPRVVDVSGYITVDNNRYSAPERLLGKTVQAHKYWDRLEIFFKDRLVAQHPRLIGVCDARSTNPAHHALSHHPKKDEPSAEEKELCAHSETLGLYAAQIKRRSPGRGIRPLKRLLDLKRTYPEDAFIAACEEALRYGLFDLTRLERMILARVAGDFFNIEEEEK